VADVQQAVSLHYPCCHPTALPCHFGTTQVWRVTLVAGGVLQARAVLQEACYACRKSITVSSVTETNCAN